jgi:hypothetical protein
MKCKSYRFRLLRLVWSADNHLLWLETVTEGSRSDSAPFGLHQNFFKSFGLGDQIHDMRSQPEFVDDAIKR